MKAYPALLVSIIAITGATLLLPGCRVGAGSVVGVSPAFAASNVPSFDHIFLVVMENHSFDGSGTNTLKGVIGSSEAPYINNTLLPMGGLATNYHNITHASLPNYLGMIDGVDHLANSHIIHDCNPPGSTPPGPSDCTMSSPTLIDRLDAAGISWKGYMESMPSNCRPTNFFPYAVRHDPFAYYAATDATLSHDCPLNDVPYSQLAGDLRAASTTPRFAFITPNVCDDMHGSGTACPNQPDSLVKQGDTWLKNNLPRIFNSPAWTTQNSLLVLTWDEGFGGSAGEDCVASTTDQSCHVATIVIGSRYVKMNYRESATFGSTQDDYSYFSLLKTIEASFGLSPISGTTQDNTAQPMTDFFATPVADCTFATLQTDLQAGGDYYYPKGQCSSPISFTSAITISANTSLTAQGNDVTLDGGGGVSAFTVDSGVSFGLSGLTLSRAAIDNSGGTVTITNSTLANSTTPSYGGAVDNSGTVTITNSTLAGNSTTSDGGAIYNDGTLTIGNSTLVDNSAPDGSAGGIDNFGTLTITNSTLTGNSALNGGGGIDNKGTLSVGGTIIANNTGGNCAALAGATETDAGYNLESSTDCGFTGTGDLQNTDPKLDPTGLQTNGGPTQTIALQFTSPAIGAADPTLCKSTSGPSAVNDLDQRGVSRQANTRLACDAGAYDTGGAIPIVKGWNLIGVPLLSSSTATPSRLATSLNSRLGANAVAAIATYADGAF